MRLYRLSVLVFFAVLSWAGQGVGEEASATAIDTRLPPSLRAALLLGDIGAVSGAMAAEKDAERQSELRLLLQIMSDPGSPMAVPAPACSPELLLESCRMHRRYGSVQVAVAAERRALLQKDFIRHGGLAALHLGHAELGAAFIQARNGLAQERAQERAQELLNLCELAAACRDDYALLQYAADLAAYMGAGPSRLYGARAALLNDLPQAALVLCGDVPDEACKPEARRLEVLALFACASYPGAAQTVLLHLKDDPYALSLAALAYAQAGDELKAARAEALAQALHRDDPAWLLQAALRARHDGLEGLERRFLQALPQPLPADASIADPAAAWFLQALPLDEAAALPAEALLPPLQRGVSDSARCARTVVESPSPSLEALELLQKSHPRSILLAQLRLARQLRATAAAGPSAADARSAQELLAINRSALSLRLGARCLPEQAEALLAEAGTIHSP